jgi:hypothetical protein
VSSGSRSVAGLCWPSAGGSARAVGTSARYGAWAGPGSTGSSAPVARRPG